MQIGHTIVALNLPSRSMLRIVTALSWCPPPPPPPTQKLCVFVRRRNESWGGKQSGYYSAGDSLTV